jgi:hypothetical protein
MDPLKQLVQELQKAAEMIMELKLHSNKEWLGPMLTMKQAAEYTGRTHSTFQKEYKKGFWTSVNIGGSGHPKFSKRLLDQDMECWVQHSRYKATSRLISKHLYRTY